MGCLSVFDISGIQEYLFRSSKLKENLGASLLVSDAIDALLKKAIEEAVAKNYPGKEVPSDWDKDKQKKFLICHTPNNIAAEIVYSGGGNVMVAFADEKIAIEVTKEFSVLLLKEAPNLTFSVAHLETDFQKDFQQERKKLFAELLAPAKNSTVRSSGLLGLSITRQCPQTGLPAVEEVEEKEGNRSKTEWISKGVYTKRERAKDEQKKPPEESQFGKFIEKPEQYMFPLDIEKLGQIHGESHIAVIHIDGNNMGDCLNDVLKGQDRYEDAIQTMRQFAKEVREKYQETFREVEQLLENNIKESEGSYYCSGKVNLQWESDRRHDRACLPARPILIDGDDVTLVAEGRLGIALAETFLKTLSQKTICINNTEYSLSACAGVAIVRTRFPFYRAYELAEALCKSAKRKAKAFDNKKVGSWLDFQIVFSGVTTDLQTLRARQYNVPGMEQPEELKNTQTGLKYKQYNLCWRPWCVSPVSQSHQEKQHAWEAFRAMFHDLVSGTVQLTESSLTKLSNTVPADILKQLKPLKNRKYPNAETFMQAVTNAIGGEQAAKKYESLLVNTAVYTAPWPRSKLKDLRNTFIKDATAIELLLQEAKSREHELPVVFTDVKPDIGFNNERRTPYFDVLELLDFYLEL